MLRYFFLILKVAKKESITTLHLTLYTRIAFEKYNNSDLQINLEIRITTFNFEIVPLKQLLH